MARRGGTFWTNARFSFELVEPGSPRPRAIAVDRPFAIVGRIPQADVQIEDRDVSARHVYLHADDRGLFAVDLATRTGTRFQQTDAPCGWLRPGDELEIAGRILRLASFSIDGRPVNPPPCAINPLSDAGDAPLVGLALEPSGGRGSSWAIGSEIAFVGRGDGCAIRLNQASVSRTHCVLLRTARAAYVIDLPGQPTLVNGAPPRGAAVIREGDVLTLGQVRFIAHVTPTPGYEEQRVGELGLAQPVRGGVAPFNPAFQTTGTSLALPAVDGPFPIDLVPPESRDAILGWMLGSLHAGQAEMYRRQEEIQSALVKFIQHIHIDAQARHEAQSAQLEALAAEVRRLAEQNQAQPSQPQQAAPSYDRRLGHAGPPPFAAAEPPRPESPPPPEIDPDKTFATAAWLLERIEKVGNENKFTFRNLLSRLGAGGRSEGDEAHEADPAGAPNGDSAPH